jgi:Kef-type K+ transport system membrane component KefB
MLDVAFVLLAVAVLLVVVGAIQPLAARLRLPPPVLLAIFGIAIGGVSSLVPPAGEPVTPLSPSHFANKFETFLRRIIDGSA